MYAYTYTHKKEKQYWGWERVSQFFLLNIIFTAHEYIDIIKLKYTFVHIIKWKIRTKRRDT